MDDNMQQSALEFGLRRSVQMVKEDPKAAKEAFSAAAAAYCPVHKVKHRSITPEECKDRQMKESTLQSRVVDRAKRRGWVVRHVGKGLTGEDGVWVSTAKDFPDLFLLHPVWHRVLAMELKREEGKFQPGQLEYLQMLNLCGIPAVVIRPSDLRLGNVNAILGPQ